MLLRTMVSCLIGSIVLAFATSAPAQRTGAAFTASGRTCSEITWEPSVLSRFPNIAEACQGVQEYDGRQYVRFDGTVRSVSPTGDRLMVQFEGTDDAIELQPPADMRVFIEGRATRVRDLSRGQELTFHVPATRFVAHFFEPGSETEFAEAPIAPASTAAGQVAQAQPASERRLPQTATALPMIALTGLGLVALGTILLHALAIVRR